jgi:hypothetical protein
VLDHDHVHFDYYFGENNHNNTNTDKGRERLPSVDGATVTKDGELIVTSQKTRSQKKNIDDAYEKIRQCCVEAMKVPKVVSCNVFLSNQLSREGFHHDIAKNLLSESPQYNFVKTFTETTFLYSRSFAAAVLFVGSRQPFA